MYFPDLKSVQELAVGPADYELKMGAAVVGGFIRDRKDKKGL